MMGRAPKMRWAAMVLVVVGVASVARGRPEVVAATEPAVPDAVPATMPANGRAGRIAMGSLVAVAGSRLIVASDPRGPAAAPFIAVETDGNTSLWIDGADSPIAELKLGMHIDATWLPPTRRRPARVQISATNASLAGTVVRVEDNKLILKTRDGEVTFTMDDQTRIRYPFMTFAGKPMPQPDGDVSDLRPGVEVKVVPPTGTAKKIYLVHQPTTTKPSKD